MSLRIIYLKVLRCHQSVSDIAIERIDRITYHSDLVTAEVRSIAAEIDDLVLYIREVETDTVHELTCLASPVQIHLPSLVVHLAGILLGRFGAQLCRIIEFQENTVSILVIPVE